MQRTIKLPFIYLCDSSVESLVSSNWNDPVSGCTFSKKTPTGLAGFRALHQLGVVLPDMVLL